MKYSANIAAFLVCAMVLSMAGMSAAAVPEERRIQITDADELAAAGFEPDAVVFKLRPETKGEDEADPADTAKLFGSSKSDHTNIAAHEMVGLSSGFLYQYGSDGYLYCDSSSTESTVTALLDLPTGVKLTGLRVWAYDESFSYNLGIKLFEECLAEGSTGAVSTTQIINTAASSGSSGYDYEAITIPYGGIDIDNHSCVYRVRFSYGAFNDACIGDDFRLSKVSLVWNRQVAPAPQTARFTDVPTNHWAFQFVEAIADAGITAGCGDGTTYCPDGTVTRAQMAVFLSAALGLHWDADDF